MKRYVKRSTRLMTHSWRKSITLIRTRKGAYQVLLIPPSISSSSVRLFNNGNGSTLIHIAGTTALVLLLHDNALTIASAGDCKAVGCQNGKPVELHQLQSADRKDELERIRSCGGHVEQWSDHARVGSSGLAVTRSLGDPDVKVRFPLSSWKNQGKVVCFFLLI